MTKLKFAKKAPKGGTANGAWRVLVVDDEEAVHQVTRLALRGVEFRGRGIEFLGAYSAAEAREVLASEKDIAVILLDVVMETDDAGLELVPYIREQLGNRFARIILRTGQPGQAPEEQVIVDYDINDYKAKTELTAQKLLTATLASLRAYADIMALEQHRRGLRQIIDATDSLYRVRSMDRFATGVLEQLGALLGVGDDGILCIQRGADAPNAIYVLAASPRYGLGYQSTLDAAGLPAGVRDGITKALASRDSVFGPDHCVFYLGMVQSQETVAYLHCAPPDDPVLRELVAMFCAKITMGFVNIALFDELTRANAELEQRVAERTAELERLAMTDTLTGIANRRAFIEALEHEMERARRSGRPLSVVSVDIDHFKTINDRYGHGGGDDVLRAATARLAEQLRAIDTIGRLGGEEFAVVLPETGLDGAVGGAERLRRALEKAEIAAGNEPVAVTASFGVAVAAEGEGVDSLLSRADEALYAAKRAGRNRVVSAPP